MKERNKASRKTNAKATKAVARRTGGAGREGADTYRLLVESTNTGFVILDEQGRVLDANQEYVRLTGHDVLADVLGRPVTDWTAPYDRERNVAEVRKCLATGSVRNLVIDYAQPSGTVVPVEINATVQLGKKAPRIIAVCRDFTEIKRIEVSMRESEERWRSLVETSAAWIWETDANIRHTYTNAFVTRCLGYQPKEFLSFDIRAIVHPDDHKLMEEIAHRAIEKKGGWSDQVLRWKHKDGSWRYIETSGLARFDRQGRFIGLRGVDRDVTDRKRTEQELADREATLQQIMDTADVAIFLVDQNGRITHANRRMADMFGASIWEIIGSEYVAHVHPQERETARTKMLALLASTIPSVDLERLYWRGDGTSFWGHLSGRRYHDIHGTELGLIGVITDIDTRKRAEEALRENAEQLDALSANLVDSMIYQINSGPDGKERRFSYLSAAIERFHGLTVDAVRQDPALLYLQVAEEDRQRVADAEARAFAEKKKLEVDVRVRIASGDVRWRRFVSMPRKGASGDWLWDGIETDVTDHVRAEERIRESESRLRTVTENAPDTILQVDRSGTILFVNRPVPGLTAEQIIGTDVYRWVPQESHPIVRHALEQVFATGKRQEYESAGPGPNGETRFYGVRVMPVLTEGTVETAIYIATDITERRQVEEALCQSEEKFRLLVETTYDWIWEVDSRGTYTYASPRVRDLLGYAPEEVVGKTPFDLMPPEERERLGEMFRGLVRRREPLVGLENINLHKDGRRIMLETSGLPIFDAAGAFKGYRGVDRDVTDRKRTEEALRESEAKYRLVVENAAEGILIAQDGEIKFANEWMRTIGGYAPEELLGTPFSRFIHPEDRELVFQQHLRRLRGEIPLDHFYDFRVLTKSGEVLWVEMKGALTTWEGRPASVNFVSNITARKKAEIALRESETRTRSIIESIPVGMHMYRLEPDGRLVFTGANPAADRMLGVDHRSLEGKTIEEVFPPLAETEVPQRYREVAATGKGWQTEGIDYQDERIRGAFEVHAFQTGPNRMVAAFEDITERKRSETALRVSEAKYRRLYNETPVLLHSIDRNAVLVAVNDYWLRRMGYERHEVIGKKVTDFYTEASRKYAEETVQPAFFREGVVRDIAYQFVAKSGEVVDVLLSAIGERDATGMVVRSQAVILDVTERKRAEAALRQNEKLLKTIIDAEPECVKLLDRDANLIMMNRAGLDMIQADSFDQVKGQCVCPMVGKDDREAFLDLTRRVFRGESGTIMFEMIGLKGRRLWLETHAVPLRNEREEITAVLGVTRDVTAKKQAVEALQASEVRFRTIIEHASSGILAADIETRRFRYANPEICRMLGYDRDELLTLSVEDIHPAEELPVVQRTFAASQPVQTRCRRKDGTVFPVDIRGVEVVLDGRPCLIGFFMDMTERHKLEAELLRSQKLESIGTLAGGIAHDFNNLLQGVFGYISMARLTYDDRERSLAMLLQAEQALHRSVGLASQLLTFSKGGKPVKKVVAVRPIIENACRFALSGSRTVCRIEAEEELWSVEADEGQISQVVQNIALNADQAMPLGGTVSVRMRNIPEGREPASESAQGKRVEISIQDSGVGIPGEYLAKIFDPYFTTKEKGSGLGLATSYSIIRNHGGTISVFSEPGKGSTFTVVLPAVDRAPEPVSQDSTPVPTRKGRVLLMDDEEVIRMVAIELIGSMGHDVEVTENGERAVELFLQARKAGRPFDIVVLDLTVRGGMGGMEALRRLREIDPDVQAVVSSGYSDDAAVANFRALGFAAFLKKPYDLTRLREVLGSLMQ